MVRIHLVEVTYPKEQRSEMEERLERVVGQPHTSCGTTLTHREVSWFCTSEEDANQVRDKLQQVEGITEVEVFSSKT